MGTPTPRDPNRVPHLVATSNADGASDVAVYADPTTHALITNAPLAPTTYGAAFPAQGSAVGYNDGTNMQGARVFDLDSGAGTEYDQGISLRISASGGSIEAKGQQTMANSIPVVLPSDQTVNAVLASDPSTVIGQVKITDGTTVATVIAATAALKTDLSSVAGSAVSTAATGVQLVGLSDGAGNKITTNSTTYTAKFGLDANLLGTLGTAFTTPGFVDIKGADGNVFVRNATAANFLANVTLQTQTDTVMVGGVNVKEINAVTPLMGNGVTGTGSLRVTIASDNTAFSVNSTLQTQTDTVMIGGVNIKEINAVAPLMGNGATGTGSLRVTPSNDSTGIANWGHGATAATAPTGATYAGRRGTTALPTAVTDGQQVGSMADKYGRTVTIAGTIRDLRGSQTTTISASTSETTIVTAAASVFNDIYLLLVTNTSATGTRIDFRDTTAGTILFAIWMPANDVRGFALAGESLPQTSVNTNWTAQSSASVTDLRIAAYFEKNK